MTRLGRKRWLCRAVTLHEGFMMELCSWLDEASTLQDRVLTGGPFMRYLVDAIVLEMRHLATMVTTTQAYCLVAP